MDDATIEAIKGSIAKWEAVVAGTGRDEGARNCPLCHKFASNGCEGCPIDSITEMGCDDRIYADTGSGDPDDDDGHRAANRAMLDFLKGLLPENDLKGKVFEALNNAVANGYEQRGASPRAIADDLVSFDADLERYQPATLIPFVRLWQKEVK